MTDQKSSSMAQNSFEFAPGGSPRHFNVEVSQSPLSRIQDSTYFFSDRKLSQLFNVDAWTADMDDDANGLIDETREPPPEPAPRGSYCPPSPGTPIVPSAGTDFGLQFRPNSENGSFQCCSDDMALGMSRLSKISCDSSLTGDDDGISLRGCYDRSSMLGDSTPVAGSPAHRGPSRYSGLSGFTLDTKSVRSSRASSSLPSILSDIVCDPVHGMEDLFGDEDDLSLSHVMQWRDSVNGSDVNWQERCLQLEISLQRFRDRAAKIRDILKDKVTDLEQRVRHAETRAERAEQKTRVMERQMSQGSPCSTRRRPDADKSHSLNTSLCEDNISTDVAKDILTSLATQVDVQKQLRMEDARKVEAKAAKIKEWVRNKLRDLEDQNTVLREQNAKCNIQLELLRGRLAHLSTFHNGKDKLHERVLPRGSLECDSRSHDDLPARIQQEHIYIPSRPSTLGRNPRSKPRSPGSLRRVSSSDTDTQFNSLQSNFKRNQNLDCDSRSVKTADQLHTSSSVDLLETPQSLSPKSPLETMLNSLAQSSHSTVRSLPQDATRKPVPQPRTKLAAVATASLGSGGTARENGVSGTKSAGSLELDLRSSYSKSKSSDSSALSDAGSLPRAKDELHDYSEIYTPNDEVPHWQNEACAGDKPPTPPLHRFPSWESRIYQLAQQGLSGAEMGSTNELLRHSSSLGSYPEIHVPVYAAVKGRASQIRSVPFTDDSSDSSDGEDHCVRSGASDPIHGVRHQSRTPSSNESSSSSPSKSKTCSLSPAKFTASSPSKIAGRDISFESGMSDDYAIPPDARSDSLSLDSTQASTASARTSCVETLTNTLSNSHIGLVSPRLDVALEKSGHLTKLGGKLKSWKKRYFVLKDGALCYWKSQGDSHRKAAGEISLHDGCVVTRSEGSHTFEINTGKKTYYLSAENTAVVEDWVKVLQNVLRRNATRLLLSKEDNKATVQGWLTKVKNGHGKQCWCVLIGKMFIYFRNQSDQNPLGQITMKDTKVDEVDKMTDSDEENFEDDIHREDLTISLLPDNHGPTYLICPNKQEKDSWLYHLTIVSGGTGSSGTEYEQLIQKLMELNGDPNCILWRHPLLLHSREQVTSPFTTLSSDQTQSESIKLFKSCQLFTSVLMDSSAIDYHIVLCQNALQLCLPCPELQAELFCGLIKLTSAHLKASAQVTKTLNKIRNRNFLTCTTQSLILDSPGSQRVPGEGVYIDPKINPGHFTFIQGWQLLSLAVSLFVPKNNKLLWYLKAHLQRNVDTKTELGKYAIYCQRALDRTIENGMREAKPSRMEVLSILLKNPYHHSLPHAIPVHFLNGTYQVVGFDGSTNVGEFVSSLNQEIGCRNVYQSGFALFSDDPIEKDLEHCLNHSARLCDLISKWETALREKGSGKFENTKVIRLLFKNRLYWKNLAKNETEREKLLLCYQVNEQIQQYKYPVNKELALEFATLMAQIDMGEVNTERSRGSGSGGPSLNHVQQIFNKFYSLKFKENLKDEDKKFLLETLQEKWHSLRGRSQPDCVRIFLTCARKWAYFGAVLFPAVTTFPDCPAGSMPCLKSSPVWVAVNEEAITLLEKTSMQPIVRYNYENVVTFGGCQQDFMLVVHTIDGESSVHPPGTYKLMLCMNKPKILELTLLIADYMNALGQGVPGYQLAGTLTRHGSIRGQPDLVQMTSDIDRKDQRKKGSLEHVPI